VARSEKHLFCSSFVTKDIWLRGEFQATLAAGRRLDAPSQGALEWQHLREAGILFRVQRLMAPVPTGHIDLQVVRRSGRDVPGADRDRAR